MEEEININDSDKRGKHGPRKITVTMRQLISRTLNAYIDSGIMVRDFQELEPKDRLVVAEKLMNYVMPKMQATAVDLKASNRDASLEERLAQLAQPQSDES